jgi:hypothetical protein
MESKLSVTLIAPPGERVVAAAARVAPRSAARRNWPGGSPTRVGELLAALDTSGHDSPRARRSPPRGRVARPLPPTVRHRIASYTQQSQRARDAEGFDTSSPRHRPRHRGEGALQAAMEAARSAYAAALRQPREDAAPPPERGGHPARRHDERVSRLASASGRSGDHGSPGRCATSAGKRRRASSPAPAECESQAAARGAGLQPRRRAKPPASA